MFVHDALSEWVLCGETDIAAADIRKSITNLKKNITGDTITGFQKEFQVYTCAPCNYYYRLIHKHWSCVYIDPFC